MSIILYIKDQFIPHREHSLKAIEILTDKYKRRDVIALKNKTENGQEMHCVGKMQNY
jgi:hypothetical protein